MRQRLLSRADQEIQALSHDRLGRVGCSKRQANDGARVSLGIRSLSANDEFAEARRWSAVKLLQLRKFRFAVMVWSHEAQFQTRLLRGGNANAKVFPRQKRSQSFSD